MKLKTHIEPGVILYNFNPSTPEAGAGWSFQAQGHFDQYSESQDVQQVREKPNIDLVPGLKLNLTVSPRKTQ